MSTLSDWRAKHTSLIFACRVVRDRFGDEAVADVAQRHMANIRKAFEEKAADLGRNDLEAFAELLGGDGETHDSRILHVGPDRLEMEVTRCAHAEIFREYRAEDIGETFMCGGDIAMIEGFNPKIKLDRPCLLMTGGACCRFVYTLEH